MQIQLLLLEYIFKHHVNCKQLEDLLKIWDLVIPGVFPKANISLTNLYPIRFYTTSFVFVMCVTVINPNWEKCKVCHEKILQEEGKSKNYFVTFPIQEQVRRIVEQQSANLLKKSELIQSANYCDILCGNFVNDLFHKDEISDSDLTLLCSIDGVHAFQSTSRNYWPVFATVHEISYSRRNKNMLLLGL